MAQIEAIVPVEIFPVQSYVDGFFYNSVHVSQCSVQDCDVTKVYLVPCVYTVLCHHRLLWLVKAYVPHMLLAPGLNGSSCFSHVYLPALTWNPVHAWDLRPRSSLTILSTCIFFFLGMWMVLMLCLARSLLILFDTVH
jgi:hypothetical protein